MKKLLPLLKTIRLWYVFFAVTMVFLIWGLLKTAGGDTFSQKQAAWGWGCAIALLIISHVWRTLYKIHRELGWHALEALLAAQKETDDSKRPDKE